MKNLKLLDTAAAKAAGYRALTVGYRLPQEQHMLDNVVADLQRGRISHCLVKTHEGIAVWRSFRSGTSGACTQGGFAGGSATGQHLTPARSTSKCLSPTALTRPTATLSRSHGRGTSRRGCKKNKTTRTAQRSVTTTRKGKCS